MSKGVPKFGTRPLTSEELRLLHRGVRELVCIPPAVAEQQQEIGLSQLVECFPKAIQITPLVRQFGVSRFHSQDAVCLGLRYLHHHHGGRVAYSPQLEAEELDELESIIAASPIFRTFSNGDIAVKFNFKDLQRFCWRKRCGSAHAESKAFLARWGGKWSFNTKVEHQQGAFGAFIFHPQALIQWRKQTNAALSPEIYPTAIHYNSPYATPLNGTYSVQAGILQAIRGASTEVLRNFLNSECRTTRSVELRTAEEEEEESGLA
jgi:hypothetical protein